MRQPKKNPELGKNMNVQCKTKLPQIERNSMQDYYNVFSFPLYYFSCHNCQVFSITSDYLEGIFSLFYSQLGRTRKFRENTEDQSTKGGLMEQEDYFFLHVTLFSVKKIIVRQLMGTALRNLKMEILYSSLITCLENAVSKCFNSWAHRKASKLHCL